MGEKLNISIKIADRNYPISIQRGDSEREELIRKAAKLINETFSNFKNRAYQNLDSQDHLAMAALQIGLMALENDNKNDLTPLIKEIKNLNYEINEAIENNVL